MVYSHYIIYSRTNTTASSAPLQTRLRIPESSNIFNHSFCSGLVVECFFLFISIASICHASTLWLTPLIGTNTNKSGNPLLVPIFFALIARSFNARVEPPISFAQWWQITLLSLHQLTKAICSSSSFGIKSMGIYFAFLKLIPFHVFVILSFQGAIPAVF